MNIFIRWLLRTFYERNLGVVLFGDSRLKLRNLLLVLADFYEALPYELAKFRR